MPDKCVWPGCKTGYASCPEKVSVFVVPKDETVRKLWQKALPRDDIILRKRHVICAKHFQEKDIIRQYVHRDAEGNIIAHAQYKVPRLKKGSVPSAVHEEPALRNNTRRKCRKRRHSPNMKKDDRNKISSQMQDAVSDQLPLKTDPGCDVDVLHGYNSFFDVIYHQAQEVTLPEHWYRFASPGAVRWIGFSTFVTADKVDSLFPLMKKCIVVEEDMSINTFVLSKRVNHGQVIGIDPIRCIQDLEIAITKFAKAQVCEGVDFAGSESHGIQSDVVQDDTGRWRHRSCSLIVTMTLCSHCMCLKKALFQRKVLHEKRNKVMKSLGALSNLIRKKS